MSDKSMTELELEEVLRGLNAAGKYKEALAAAEKYRTRQSALNKICRFENPATTYQYMIALSRLGRFEEAMSLRWRDMVGWSGFTDELKGDWYRDGHARYFLAKNDPSAAKGAVAEAMKLHVEGSPKYMLDRLVMALVLVVQNRLPHALEQVASIVDELDQIEFEKRREFCSVDRLAKWWLLLLKYALGQLEDTSNLPVWVATHDASEWRQKIALELGRGRNPAKKALRAINKEIKGS